MTTVSDVLRLNRQKAGDLVQKRGLPRTRALLERAERDLQRRVREAVEGPGDKSFTAEQARATLHQVRHVLATLGPGLRSSLEDQAGEVAEVAARGSVEYLQAADEAYRGVGTQPLSLDEAAVMDQAVVGARASVARRLASSGEPVKNADGVPHKAKAGLLERYGMGVIEDFEETLQAGVVGRKSFDEMKSDLVAQSPFLQGKPAFWAERLTRSELHGAYNHAAWEATREADEQLGDVVKIVCATFDARTGEDSYNVHGEIRYPDEAFDYVGYDGEHTLFQYPPNRPNDREVVVTHRISWAIPKGLMVLPDGLVKAQYLKRRRAFHGRPLLTTIPFSKFGA